jgi:hypothetical protein
MQVPRRENRRFHMEKLERLLAGCKDTIWEVVMER